MRKVIYNITSEVLTVSRYKIKIRSYSVADYPEIAALYKSNELFGGQFDEDRDSSIRLRNRIENDPQAIFVAERDGKIVGTISTIDDGRVAWLFRFAVVNNDPEICFQLCEAALQALQEKGHRQVLVYAPTDNHVLLQRYSALGFTQGNSFTCFWKTID